MSSGDLRDKRYTHDCFCAWHLVQIQDDTQLVLRVTAFAQHRE